MYSSAELFSTISVAAVILTGLAMGPSSGLTAGALVGFIFLTYRFLEPIAELTEWVEQTQTAVAGLRRVLGVLDIPIGPPEPSHPTPLPDGALDIELRHVTFAYTSRGEGEEAPAVVDVDGHIDAGQYVALVGATGSGKTTLGRLMARMMDPTSGVVRLGGVSLSNVANDDLRRALVVVAQEPFLFQGSIVDNLRFARPGLGRTTVENAVSGLGLDEWLAGLPGGLDTEVGTRGSRLSSGERQLVALLRASLVDPRVLVLDEATSSVDAITEVRLTRALDRLSAGRTTVAIAHRLSTAVHADRVMMMEHGRLIADGPHAELLVRSEPYRRLYDSWITTTTPT
jgi:putative ABC transport system ATP-binding protein